VVVHRNNVSLPTPKTDASPTLAKHLDHTAIWRRFPAHHACQHHLVNRPCRRPPSTDNRRTLLFYARVVDHTMLVALATLQPTVPKPPLERQTTHSDAVAHYTWSNQKAQLWCCGPCYLQTGQHRCTAIPYLGRCYRL
jgi:hypothetical protein